MSEIAKLFSEAKYEEILNTYLSKLQHLQLGRDEKKRQKNVELLYYLLGACAEKGCYFDCIDVLKKLHELQPCTTNNWSPEQLMYFSSVANEALVYLVVNKPIERYDIFYNIEENLNKSIAFQEALISTCNVVRSDRQKEILTIYKDYQAGNIPIYTVSFLYPFEPIVPDYTFDLTPCYPYISFQIKRELRSTDCFSEFIFKAYGLINTRMDWMGPKWLERSKFPIVSKALHIVNMMLLQAVKASPGKMVTPYSIEQVSTVSMNQYRYNQEETVLGGLVTGTDFSSHLIGGNSQWHVFTEDEMVELNKRIISTYANKSFVRVFHHATNLLSAGFYNESFLLLCFACEGMFYHWCGELAKVFNIEEDYNRFSNTKVSRCDTCNFYTDHTLEKPMNGMEPSLSANLTYFKEKKCITDPEMKTLNKYLYKVRNNNLRSKIVHGKRFDATKKNVEESLSALLEMQNYFVNLIREKKGT